VFEILHISTNCSPVWPTFVEIAVLQNKTYVLSQQCVLYSQFTDGMLCNSVAVWSNENKLTCRWSEATISWRFAEGDNVFFNTHQRIVAVNTDVFSATNLAFKHLDPFYLSCILKREDYFIKLWYFGNLLIVQKLPAVSVLKSDVIFILSELEFGFYVESFSVCKPILILDSVIKNRIDIWRSETIHGNS
jgi:hypothetical protein